MKTVYIVVISDASFADSKTMQRHLEFSLLMADDNSRDNNVRHRSKRCHRASRSAIAAEVYDLVQAFHISYVIRKALVELVVCDIVIETYVDSRTLFHIIAKEANNVEHRIQIDVYALRES